jgi:hypothetical protein
MITSNAYWKAMKKTLDGITTEDLSKEQVCFGKNKLFEMESMEDGYSDYVEVSGTTLLVEKDEGKTMAVDPGIIMGGTKRLIPRTMAKKVIISEEAMEDLKYKEIINASKRLQASAWKTQDIDGASVVLNCTSTLQGYDNLALVSTSHTLPGGGTESNYIALDSNSNGITMTPSTQAIIQMRAKATLMKGPNGIIDSRELKGLTFPAIQIDLWDIITGTKQAVGSNWNDINTVSTYGLYKVPVKWYDAVSTTIWGGLTDAEDGFIALQKRKIRGRVWVDNDAETAMHSVSYRMAIGVANWRCFILGNT